MIINFSVENFGSIKEKQTLSFEADNSDHLEEHYIIKPTSDLRLLKMALIYGANASGKTTILKALDFLRDLVLEPKDKKTESLDFEPFLFDAETPHLNSNMSLEFIQNEVRYLYEVEFSKKAIVSEVLYFFNLKKATVYSRKTDLDNQFTEITFGSKIKKDKIFEKTLEANTLWNNTVLGGFLKTNIEQNELKEVINWFEIYLMPLIYSELNLSDTITNNIDNGNLTKETILRIIKAADFNIVDIVLDKEEHKAPDIVFQHDLNGTIYSLPFYRESQGTQRFYGFAGLLNLMIRGHIIFSIDELETSLHPDLYTHFLLSFIMNAKSSQLIATTHNREILNNKDIFRNDAIWFTEKNEHSATQLYSLADFDSSVVRDTTNVLNAYKSGKLGATPNLGDYYIDLE